MEGILTILFLLAGCAPVISLLEEWEKEAEGVLIPLDSGTTDETTPTTETTTIDTSTTTTDDTAAADVELIGVTFETVAPAGSAFITNSVMTGQFYYADGSPYTPDIEVLAEDNNSYGYIYAVVQMPIDGIAFVNVEWTFTEGGTMKAAQIDNMQCVLVGEYHLAWFDDADDPVAFEPALDRNGDCMMYLQR